MMKPDERHQKRLRENIAAFGRPGSPIPGSIYVRGYCTSCAEPIRVRLDEKGVPLRGRCSTCRSNEHPGYNPIATRFDDDSCGYGSVARKALEEAGND